MAHTQPFPRSINKQPKSSSSMLRQMRYNGLFSPQAAPNTRGYCLLLSFLTATLMLTTGSVFFHVILRHPVSGSHPMHTPSLPLALALVTGGTLLLITCLTIVWRLVTFSVHPSHSIYQYYETVWYQNCMFPSPCTDI